MSQSFRVLLVEDDDSLRCCLVEFLASQGWEVGATAAATEALQLARQRRFDFSLMDFHLPGMTGLQLFQQLVALRPLPAILMSGLASAEEAAAAQHAGFFTFLRKPLDLGRLRQSLEALIQTHFGGPLIPLRMPTTHCQTPSQQVPGQSLSGQSSHGQPSHGQHAPNHPGMRRPYPPSQPPRPGF